MCPPAYRVSFTVRLWSIKLQIPSWRGSEVGENSACAGRVLAHSITFRHREIPDKFPVALTKAPQSARIERVLPESGPVAQLGARFHGMEEVIGSIPIRSTNYFNYLEAPPFRDFVASLSQIPKPHQEPDSLRSSP